MKVILCDLCAKKGGHYRIVAFYKNKYYKTLVKGDICKKCLKRMEVSLKTQ